MAYGLKASSYDPIKKQSDIQFSGTIQTQDRVRILSA